MEYLIADLLAASIWFYFYYQRKDLRTEMLIMSVLALPLALFDFLYIPSYWKPVTLFSQTWLPMGLEGFLFSFSAGGVATASATVILKKEMIKAKSGLTLKSMLPLFVVLPIAFVFHKLFPINIAISMDVGVLAGILAICVVRPELIRSCLQSSVIFGTIYTVTVILWANLFPSTREWFPLEGLPKLFLMNACVYEIVFGFIFGAYWGSLYKLLFGYKIKE